MPCAVEVLAVTVRVVPRSFVSTDGAVNTEFAATDTEFPNATGVTANKIVAVVVCPAASVAV